MATLLPNAKQQFLDGNGVPLAGGSVYTYVPGTTTLKATWQDAGQVAANTNPIILDASGEAIIYGAGNYRQQVFDVAGNLVWDQLTADTAAGGVAWGGTSTGSANAQVVVGSSFSQQDGQQLSFIAGFTNTGALTVAGIPVLLDGATGPVPLTGGEVEVGNAVSLIYQAARGAFHLVQNNTYNIVAPGAVMAYAMSTAPAGWLECNGASVLRATYPNLFNAIGTTYGSVDGTHFTLPDIRGQFVRGWDHGAGVDTGRVFGSLQAFATSASGLSAIASSVSNFVGAAMAAISFPITLRFSHGANGNSVARWSDGDTPPGGSGPTTNYTDATSPGTPSGSVSTTTTITSISGATETRPTNVALLYCIKY